MNLTNFEIPERTNFNFIYFEALALNDGLWDTMGKLINSAIEQERAKWIGAILRATENE